MLNNFNAQITHEENLKNSSSIIETIERPNEQTLFSASSQPHTSLNMYLNGNLWGMWTTFYTTQGFLRLLWPLEIFKEMTHGTFLQPLLQEQTGAILCLLPASPRTQTTPVVPRSLWLIYWRLITREGGLRTLDSISPSSPDPPSIPLLVRRAALAHLYFCCTDCLENIVILIFFVFLMASNLLKNLVSL